MGQHVVAASMGAFRRLLTDSAQERRVSLVFVSGDCASFIEACVREVARSEEHIVRRVAPAAEGAVARHSRLRLVGSPSLTLASLALPGPWGAAATLVSTGVSVYGALVRLLDDSAEGLALLERAGGWIPSGRAGVLAVPSAGVWDAWLRELLQLAGGHPLFYELPLVILVGVPGGPASHLDVSDDSPLARAGKRLVDSGHARWWHRATPDARGVLEQLPGTDPDVAWLVAVLADGSDSSFESITELLLDEELVGSRGTGIQPLAAMRPYAIDMVEQAVLGADPGFSRPDVDDARRLIGVAALQGVEFCGTTATLVASSGCGEGEFDRLLQGLASPGTSSPPLHRLGVIEDCGAGEAWAFRFRDASTAAWGRLTLPVAERRLLEQRLLDQLLARYDGPTIYARDIERLARQLDNVPLAERMAKQSSEHATSRATYQLQKSSEATRQEVESLAALLLSAAPRWDSSNRQLMDRLIDMAFAGREFGLYQKAVTLGQEAVSQADRHQAVHDAEASDTCLGCVDDRGRAFLALGSALQREGGSYQAAEAALEAARQASLRACDTSQTRRRRQRLATTLRRLGLAYIHLGEPRRALEPLLDALRHEEALSAKKPTDASLSGMASVRWALGIAHRRLGDVDEAFHYLDHARTDQEALVKRSPGDATRRWNLVLTYRSRALLLRDSDPVAAAQNRQSACEHARILVDDDPTPANRQLLADQLRWAGEHAYRRKRYSDAIDLLSEAEPHAQSLRDDEGNWRDRHQVLHWLGYAYLARRQPGDAQTAVQKLLHAEQILHRIHGENCERDAASASIQRGLGLALGSCGPEHQDAPRRALASKDAHLWIGDSETTTVVNLDDWDF